MKATTFEITGAIIAGGTSRRMGRDKRLLPVQGQSLIVHVLRTLQVITDAQIIVANDPQTLRDAGVEVPIITDHIQNAAAMGGIYTALRTSPTEWVLCVAADMPSLQVPLLRAMQQRVNPALDVVLPVHHGKAQSLHALYRKTVIPVLEDRIERGALRIGEVFADLRVSVLGDEDIRKHDPDGSSFVNLNTPGEYEGFIQRSR